MSTVDDALRTLYRAAAPNLSHDELVTISDLTEEARCAAQRLGVVCEGIAMLVISDSEGAVGAGNFAEPGSVVELLLTLGHSLDVIAGLIRIGSDATSALKRSIEGKAAPAVKGGKA